MRAVLCGYYGKGNGGDEALLASLLQMLPSTVTPVVLSGNPAQTQETHGVEACDRQSAFTVLQVLQQSDAFIWGGGSLIQDVTSALSPVYYVGLMGLAQRMGLKTIAWAQGVGPLKRPLTQWMAKQAFAGCDAISVRDSGSAQILASWNLPLVMAPDPVWALEAKPVSGFWDLPAPRVAIALRPHPLLTAERLQTFATALVQFQRATEAFILLVPFQPSQDLAIAQTLHAQLPGVSQILTLSDPRQLRGIFQGVEMAIAMRFHGLIMAAAAECRCLAISYDPKVSQLMQDLDLPGWKLSQFPDDPTLLCHTWLEHYANGEALSQNQIQALTDRALLHRDLLHEVLLK
jgi:polysaccharide pyruvyl transferase CsaB